MKNQSATKSGKLILVFLSVCALLLCISGAALAAEPVKVIVNGNEISFPDAQPFIDGNGRTQVPVRFIAEAMQAQVEWDSATRTVHIERGRIALSMTIGVKEIVVLKVKKAADTAPIIQENRTFVPLRFISEGLGAEVQWEGASRTVRITDDSRDKYRVENFLIYIEANDKVGLNTMRCLTMTKESGLSIAEATDEGYSIWIQINVDIPTTDIPTQRQETEALLKQCLSEKLVDEIMAYAAQKQTRSEKLDTKIFKEGRYDIYVGGSIGPLMITIWIR